MASEYNSAPNASPVAVKSKTAQVLTWRFFITYRNILLNWNSARGTTVVTWFRASDGREFTAANQESQEKKIDVARYLT